VYFWKTYTLTLAWGLGLLMTRRGGMGRMREESWLATDQVASLNDKPTRPNRKARQDD
jgi:hypothetical protein